MNSDILGLSNLRDVVNYDIRKLAGAESQLMHILPEWEVKATSFELKKSIRRYQDMAGRNYLSLQTYIQGKEITAFNRSNQVMQAIIVETREKLSNCADIEVADACLIDSLQGMIHYKINLYGSVAAYSGLLNDQEFEKLFHNAKADEESMLLALNKLAMSEINLLARAPIHLTASAQKALQVNDQPNN